MRTSLLAIAVTFSLAAFAAEAPLGNADVVKLVQAGLSAATIEAKIRASEVAFATDVDALVALAKAGVPDEVIRVMVERQGQPARPAAPQAKAPAPATAPAKALPKKRFTVALQTAGGGRCGDAELEADAKGLRLTRCGENDFAVQWKDVESICYASGFRGTAAIAANGTIYRLSTTTPVEMQAVRDAIRKLAPGVRERCG